MEPTKLDIEQIDTRSGFNFERVSRANPPRASKALELCVKLNEPIEALLLDGENRLIDGFKRLFFLEKFGISSPIEARRLDQDAPPISVALIALARKESLINRSFAMKARFIHTARAIGCRRDELIETILPLLMLAPEERSLKEIELINRLEERQVDFLDEKSLSRKESIRLARSPREALAKLFDLKDRLALSAAAMRELAEKTKEIIQRDSISVDDLFARGEIRSIIDDDALSARERGAKARGAIDAMKNPLSSATNRFIDARVKNIAPPSPVKIDWDRSLESSAAQITVTIESIDELDEASAFIRSDQARRALSEILGKL